MIGLLGSMMGGRGGRMIGQMIGGRNGAMIGGLLGSLVGSRQLGRLGRSVMGGRGSGGNRAMASPTAPPPSGGDVLSENEAQVLVRAMGNAAKADGAVDEDEAQLILRELGNDASPDELRFIERELATPAMAAADMAAEVPASLASEAYAVSVLAIEVDTAAEHAYLQELATALRIRPADRRELHAELGVAPPLA